MSKDVSMGILSGTEKSMDKQFIFSTMQTISKDDVYTQFSPEKFDLIIVEVHEIIGRVKRSQCLCGSRHSPNF